MKQILSDEAREAKNAYQKEWRRKKSNNYNEYIRNWRRNNPDKVQQYNAEYWERKAEKLTNNKTALETLEAKVYRLHNYGFSLRQIAEKTGINHVKVSRILKRYSDVTA